MGKGWVRTLRGLAARIRGVVFRADADRGMNEELRFHIEMETEKNVRSGMSPDAARRAALVAFGGVEQTRQSLRDGREAPIVEPFLRDLRFAGRSILRSPGFSIIAVLTVAIGVGATTAVFTVANAILFQTVDLPGSERLVSVDELRSGRTSSGIEGRRIPYARYEAYAEGVPDAFQGLAARAFENVALRLDGETLSAKATLSSGNFFEVLALTPQVGRFYQNDTDPFVVISARLWRDHFGSDPNVEGRSVHVDSSPFTVVGVAPESFRGSGLAWAPDLWVPLAAGRGGREGPWAQKWVGVFGRLRDGSEEATAQSVAQTVALSVPPADAGTTVRGVSLERLGGIPSFARGGVAGFLGLLLATALLVLLTAAANLAGMQLARSAARSREFAIRRALGAGRGRLARHLLAEGMLLFTVAGLLGVGVARWATALLERTPLPPQVDVALVFKPDITVLLFAVAVTTLTGIVFSLVPALHGSRGDLVPALKGSSAFGAPTRTRTRALFVGGQVAMSTLLLVVASLFGRSLQKGLTTDVGFEPEGVYTATLNVRPHGYDGPAAAAFFQQLVERTAQVEGVESVGLSDYVLLNGDQDGTRVSNAGPDEEGAVLARAGVLSIDPGYLPTIRMDLTDGRTFTSADGRGAARVVVVNEVLAERMWPERTAVGQRLRMGDEWLDVVGVTENAKYAFMTEAETPFAFFPVEQAPRGSMALHVRAPALGARVLQDVRRIVRELDPNIAVESSGSAADLVDFSLFPQRLAGGLVGAFGIIGLALAVLGVYGVLSFQVTQRTREFGVRRALGADGAAVTRQVVRGGLVLAAAGCAVGLVGGWALSRAAKALLIGLHPLDPATYLGVPTVLMLVALVAALIPARRASAVQALEALGAE